MASQQQQQQQKTLPQCDPALFRPTAPIPSSRLASQSPSPYLLETPMLSSSAEPPPAAEVPKLIRSLFEFCQLGTSMVDSYLWLVNVSVTAEDIGDKFLADYVDFMQNTNVMLRHIRRCIDVMVKVPRADLDEQYGMLPSYQALMAYGEQLPELLDRLNDYSENLKSIQGSVLNGDKELYAKVAESRMRLHSIDHSWRTCVDDVKATLGSSANESV